MAETSKAGTLKADEGWWEYAVGGRVWGVTGKPAPIWPSSCQLAAEIEAQRYEPLYVVRRWVTPGLWSKLAPEEDNDHHGVDNFEWENYLDWRTKQQQRAGHRLPDITDLPDPKGTNQ